MVSEVTALTPAPRDTGCRVSPVVVKQTSGLEWTFIVYLFLRTTGVAVL